MNNNVKIGAYDIAKAVVSAVIGYSTGIVVDAALDMIIPPEMEVAKEAAFMVGKKIISATAGSAIMCQAVTSMDEIRDGIKEVVESVHVKGDIAEEAMA